MQTDRLWPFVQPSWLSSTVNLGKEFNESNPNMQVGKNWLINN